MNNKVSVLLHPIRMRVVQTLIGGRHLTVQQIGERLSDVPQATLYRHLNKLLETEMVIVVDENKVRGTVEKVFALNETSTISKDDLKEISPQEHFNYFFTFLSNLLGDFEGYLNSGYIDLLQDGVSYRQANLYLSDNELKNLLQSISELVVEASKNEPSEERRLRTMATIILPQKNKL